MILLIQWVNSTTNKDHKEEEEVKEEEVEEEGVEEEAEEEDPVEDHPVVDPKSLFKNIDSQEFMLPEVRKTL